MMMKIHMSLFVILITILLSLSSFGQTLTRGPYLQKGTPTSVVVKWRTSTATQTIVKYDTNYNSLSQTASDLTPKTEHEIEIMGLSPDTKYFYQLNHSSGVLEAKSPDLFFKTHPVVGTSHSSNFWILGDAGTAGDLSYPQHAVIVRDAYYSYIGSDDTDGILFLGDNAYEDGTDSQYQTAIFDMYKDKLKNTIAWSTFGNHDGYSADSGSQTGPYYNIFTLPTNGESGGMESGTEAYYSFDYGNIHFIVLDSYESNRSIGGSMYNWALSDIVNTTQKWIVAFWHHPPYSKGSHDSDTEGGMVEMRVNFLPMLENNGVDLVLSGHSHSYERSYLINGHYDLSSTFNSTMHTVSNGYGDGKTDGDGAYCKSIWGTDSDKGTVYVVTGSAGHTTTAYYGLNHDAMFYGAVALGSCVLHVDDDNLTVKFIRENGNIDDYFTINKPDDALDINSFQPDSNQVLIYSSSSPKSIFVNGLLLENACMEIYDIQGRVVLNKQLNRKISTNIFDVSNIDEGLYVVKVKVGSRINTRKIIIN